MYNKISKTAFLLPAAFIPVKMHSVWPEIKYEFLVPCHFHSLNSTLFLAFGAFLSIQRLNVLWDGVKITTF